MKKCYILFLLLTCFFFSCKQEDIGQKDSVPPGEITSPTVANVPGGAIISYVIPDAADLLYVKAIYKLGNGEVMEQKASEYVNSLKIEGIGKSQEVPVTLIAVDRSNNESKPVVVITHPLDAPIYSVLNSIQAFNDFGGIRLTWANPTQADVVLCVITKDSLGNFVEAQNFYSSSAVGNGNVRGYKSAARVFGMFLRDRWGNRTDTITNTFTPYFEQEIKSNTFVRWNPTGIPYNYNTTYSTYHIEKLWDGDITTFYLENATAVGYPLSFTFDMGKLAKLSRFHQWQRQGATLIYTSQNVLRFELWGSASPNVNASFSGWTFLGDFTSTKPSGSVQGVNTADDQAFAVAGQDFAVDPAAPPVRYIRYVIKATWSNDLNPSIAELKLFGSLQ